MPLYFTCKICGKETPYTPDKSNCCRMLPMYCANCGRDLQNAFPGVIFDWFIAPNEYIDVDSTEIDLEKLLKTEES